MKVYLITGGEYSEYHVFAVKLDKEEAEKVCAEQNEISREDSFHVEEYDTEDIKVDSATEVKKRYEVMEYYGGLRIDGPTYVFSDINKLKSHKRKNGDNWISGIATFPKSITDEKAHKIIQDRVAKFKAEKEGIC